MVLVRSKEAGANWVEVEFGVDLAEELVATLWNPVAFEICLVRAS